jgi:hypothetical protein
MPPNEKVPEGLRIAVILHGLVHRSLRHVVESLRDQLISPLTQAGRVDVFYHSWDVLEIHNPRAKESGILVDTAEVGHLLPEARGIFESQEEFDRSVKWERLFEKNPMRNCTGNEEEARATLMNFRRSLESQERAWEFFQKTKTRRYDVVVATRADLRFLDELETSDIESSASHVGAGRVWLPNFHSWGGVNDRFVIGNEEGVGIWSNRVVFAEEWLEKANGESAEWLLMKWLEKNQVRVGFIDFTFQRVRANGEVAERDRDLRAAARWKNRKTRQAADDDEAKVKERFLILAREAGPQAESLRKRLERLGRVEVIVDSSVVKLGELRNEEEMKIDRCISPDSTRTEHCYIYLTDEESDGYGGLMSTSGPFPKITAWSRAFVHLARTLEDDEAVWFVEDDVAGNYESFAELVSKTACQNPDLAALELKTKQEDKHWPWWSYAEEHFEEPCRGFQPLCRLSGRLVQKVLDFRQSNGGFTFHEVLFPSLAHAAGMRCLEWTSSAAFKHLFHTFRYRPNVTAVRIGISHPVKDAALHESACSAPPSELPRIRLARFEGHSILFEVYAFLSGHCRRNGIKKVAEFGPGDSTLAFLDAGCRVVSFEHDIGWLEKATRRFQGEHEVSLMHCPEGTVPETCDLPFVPEMVFVDGLPMRQGQEKSHMQPCEWALEVCGYFLLHDTKRDAEMATLAEMERRGMHVTHIFTRKGLAIVVDPHRRPEMISDRAAL